MKDRKKLESPNIFLCFEIIARIYHFCCSYFGGVTFSDALTDEKTLLSFVEGEGHLQDYLRKGIHFLSKQEEHPHFLLELQYELTIALRKIEDDAEIRALLIAYHLLLGLDLQERSPPPIPQFLLIQMHYELNWEQREKILSILEENSSFGMIGVED